MRLLDRGLICSNIQWLWSGTPCMEYLHVDPSPMPGSIDGPLVLRRLSYSDKRAFSRRLVRLRQRADRVCPRALAFYAIFVARWLWSGTPCMGYLDRWDREDGSLKVLRGTLTSFVSLGARVVLSVECSGKKGTGAVCGPLGRDAILSSKSLDETGIG